MLLSHSELPPERSTVTEHVRDVEMMFAGIACAVVLWSLATESADSGRTRQACVRRVPGQLFSHALTRALSAATPSNRS